MSEQKRTLVILSPGFPANEADSVCLPFPQLFVKTMKQLNPSLEIIVLAFQYPFVKSTYKWHGVTIISFDGRNKGKLSRLLTWRAIRKRLSTIVKENNVPGILNFWLGECGLIGKYAAKKYGLPSYTWLLGQDAREGNRYFALIKPAATDLIALSDFLAAEFYRNYAITPAHIIPPGADATKKPSEEILRDIDVLGVGSLIPLKRYDTFVRILSRLVCSRPAIKAIICGQGADSASLQKMIDDANLSSNITLCGELPHEEITILMQRSKVLLHPSSYEGFATVYTEALFAGAHVVGFCQPMQTLFQHQHTVTTEDEMFTKVSDLLNDNNLRHESVLTYPIALTCKKILQLYSL